MTRAALAKVTAKLTEKKRGIQERDEGIEHGGVVLEATIKALEDKSSGNDGATLVSNENAAALEERTAAFKDTIMELFQKELECERLKKMVADLKELGRPDRHRPLRPRTGAATSPNKTVNIRVTLDLKRVVECLGMIRELLPRMDRLEDAENTQAGR